MDPFYAYYYELYFSDLTFMGREKREENNYFAKLYRKKNEMI